MAQQAVVIGAGAIGVAAAHSLDEAGWRVTLVDRGEVGGGCSYGNACLVVPSHSHPVPGPGVVVQALRWMLRPDSPFHVRPRLDRDLFRWLWQFRRFCSAAAAERGFAALLALSRLSLELFDRLVPDGGVSFFFERRGLLNVYLSAAGTDLARRERATLERAGFRVRLLSGAEARALEPALGEGVRAGLFVEGEAHGNCLEYVRALAAALGRRGVRLLTGRAVTRVVVERGRVTGVALGAPGEELSSDLVVLAAGVWTPELARPLGIEIPLQAAKGYSATVDSYPGAPTLPILAHETRVAITPLGPRLRFGGTLELAGLDPRLDATRYRAVLRGGRAVLGAALRLENEERWCGFRPLTPDGLPIIDRAPGVEGLIVATGHGMLGFTQSLATGTLVAELATGRPPSVPLAAFRLGRFRGGPR